MSSGTNVRILRRSLFVLASLIFLGFGICILRLFYLQIIKGKELYDMALSQQLKDTKISAQRGTIYDCNMKPLAQSATVWTVALEPLYLKKDSQKELIADGLSSILEPDLSKRDSFKQEILEKANRKSYYVIVKRKIESEFKDKIIEFKKKNKISSGMRLIEDSKRYYPYGDFASSVIGFTGVDGQGLSGLENYYDKYLTGESGRIKTAKNAVGTDMPFDYEKMINAKNGCSLVLTIDEVIQHFLEKHLEEGIADHKVINRAAAIMMDVDSGKILGMAIKGGFDLNNPFEIANKDDKLSLEKLSEEERKKALPVLMEKQWRNKAVSDTYYPGSVFKIVTSSMALEENLIKEDLRFNCTGSVVPFNGAKPVRCHKHGGHGIQIFDKAFCNSCNPAFIKLGQLLGPRKFYDYYQTFGFTEKTGIDLPGEASGIFFSKDGSMGPMDLVVASFGQNFTVTPIQMITAAAASVNGGYLLKPYIVEKIIDPDGNIVKTNEKFVKRQVISSNTSKKIRELLELNAKEGGAKNGYVPGYRIGGKTGTSEKIGQSRSGRLDYISSFFCVAPSDRPKLALLIYYDTPTAGGHFGSQVAAPVAAKIMADVLPYLGVEQRFTQDEATNLNVSVPFLVGSSKVEAENKLKRCNLLPVVYGNGEYVISQNPDVGIVVSKGGSVVIYTEKNIREKVVKVPNLVGSSLSSVNREVSNLKLNLVIRGVDSSTVGSNFVASSQSISPGAIVKQSSVIEVTFVKKKTEVETD